MHKKLLLLITFTAAFSMLAFGTDQAKLATGWYFLSKTEGSGVVLADIDGPTLYAVEEIPIIAIGDVKKVSLKTMKAGDTPMKLLEMKLSSAGRVKWAAATKRMAQTDESAVFVFDNKVVYEKRTNTAITNGVAFLGFPDPPPHYLNKLVESIMNEIR